MSEVDNSYKKERQFLRHAKVVIKNFKKEVKTTIGNEFEIEFNYFKTIDQTQEDDSGTITIYGLTDDTIALIEEEGGEVWFDCGYEQSFIGTLFIAHISRVYTQVNNNITATTLECSANLLTHFFSGFAISDESTPLPLIDLLSNLGTSLGYPATVFSYDNVPESKLSEVGKFVNTYKTDSYNIGDLRTILEYVTDYYGLNFSRALVDDVDSAVFSFSDLGLKKTLKAIDTGYVGLDVLSTETQNLLATFTKTIVSPESLTSGFVLTRDTGLIESQNEYQIVTSFLDQKLNANERETAESVYKRNNPQEEPKGKDDIGSYTESGDGYVSNSVLSGLTIKGGVGGQATGGGQVRGYTADFARIVSATVGSDLIQFTGFNDIHHIGKNSRHNKGQAFDLTIKSGNAGAPNQKSRILQAAKENGYNVAVLDEYNFPSPNATGGHLHVSVYGRSDKQISDTDVDGKEEKSFESQSEADFYGRVSIEINRRYHRIKALLNPSVKPQSIIFTEDKNSDSGDYLIHRVRHASYSGNNKRGEWAMELYCEDTETERVSGTKVESTPISTDLADTSVTN